jgi:hypothetical protein
VPKLPLDHFNTSRIPLLKKSNKKSPSKLPFSFIKSVPKNKDRYNNRAKEVKQDFVTLQGKGSDFHPH